MRVVKSARVVQIRSHRTNALVSGRAARIVGVVKRNPHAEHDRHDTVLILGCWSKRVFLRNANVPSGSTSRRKLF